MSAANGVFGWTDASTRSGKRTVDYEGRHRMTARASFGWRRLFYNVRHRRG